ncbi:hypothetical protein FJZ36_11550 [Candidatus Poribacteria bacterium]|nr:hypothetical protein [Candidatus Poribacteria bacterium]
MRGSVFFNVGNAERVANPSHDAWVDASRASLAQSAEPWASQTDESLWNLMFGSAIRRSWMVWSDGYCPACREPVVMYSWIMDALRHPWKTRCPSCRALFPTNDFDAYHRSGMDRRGVFDPQLADRSLLFNVEHPNPDDPLYRFGVDDGEGYVDGERRWRFVGAYLIFGQWKQVVLGGIRALSSAYVATGDRTYAHKAGVLLDRVADLYADHDFGAQGVMYEGPPRSGYVSTWHDACEETRHLALAYDQVRPALASDDALASFAEEKSRRFDVPRSKESPADILSNIEQGILSHALEHTDRIYSNCPRTDVAIATIKLVLDPDANRDEVERLVDGIIQRSTAVDGLTGEKGLGGYTALAVHATAELLAYMERAIPGFLRDALRRYPRLVDMFRFHIDTWCFEQYYPQIGDSGSFGRRHESYAGVSLSREPTVHPSMYGFLCRLHEATGDPAYAQIVCRTNNGSVDGLPYDCSYADASAVQRTCADAVAQHGESTSSPSVNKTEWCLAVLRGRDRVLWLDYDAGGAHGHQDCMNIGLFAYGLDLMPDLGYPPVQFGGWGSSRAVWYTRSLAHNTVVVDGLNQRPGVGVSTLWAIGDHAQAARAAAPGVVGCSRYERTLLAVNMPSDGFYVVDVFRVRGGTEHVKLQHAHFCRLEAPRLRTTPFEWMSGTDELRELRIDRSPSAPWEAVFHIDDRYGYLPDGERLCLRYFDLTVGAEAGTCEGWFAPAGMASAESDWLPRLLVRRAGADPLESVFVSVIEPYRGASVLRSAQLLASNRQDCGTDVAVEIIGVEGWSDVVLLPDPEPEEAAGAQQRSWDDVEDIRLSGDVAIVRRSGDRRGTWVAFHGASVEVESQAVISDGQRTLTETWV